MRKFFPAAVGLASLVVVGAAIAVAPGIGAQSQPLAMQAHALPAHKAMAGHTHNAGLVGRLVQDRKALQPPLFHMCQQQDPTSVPAGAGSLSCYPLAY